MSLSTSQKSYAFFKSLSSAEVEEFWVAALNPYLQLIEAKMLFKGTIDSCPFHPRDLIRFLCISNASFFIVAHNHPSGCMQPSEGDLKVTKKIIQIAKLIEISVCDHLIISKDSYFSFADQQLLFRKNR